MTGWGGIDLRYNQQMVIDQPTSDPNLALFKTSYIYSWYTLIPWQPLEILFCFAGWSEVLLCNFRLITELPQRIHTCPHKSPFDHLWMLRDWFGMVRFGLSMFNLTIGWYIWYPYLVSAWLLILVSAEPGAWSEIRNFPPSFNSLTL